MHVYMVLCTNIRRNLDRCIPTPRTAAGRPGTRPYMKSRYMRTRNSTHFRPRSACLRTGQTEAATRVMIFFIKIGSAGPELIWNKAEKREAGGRGGATSHWKRTWVDFVAHLSSTRGDNSSPPPPVPHSPPPPTPALPLLQLVHPLLPSPWLPSRPSRRRPRPACACPRLAGPSPRLAPPFASSARYVARPRSPLPRAARRNGE